MKKTLMLITLFVVSLSVGCNFVQADTNLSCGKTLSKGSKGEQVKILQQKLNSSTSCNLEADGSFGSKTAWCVKKFQKDNNLTVDGKVGPATCRKVNSSSNTAKQYTLVKVKNSTGANIRKSPNTSSDIYEDAPKGTLFKVISSTTVSGKTWYKIKYKNSYAYVNGNMVSKINVKNGIVLTITEQNLELFRSGKRKLNVPVVTGNKAKEHDTPTGQYSVGYKDKNLHLPKYNADVDYWITFKGNNYGFHDAKWRSGSQLANKETYLKNGSHGCVNMFLEDAKYLYNNTYGGMGVYILNY